MRAGALWTIKIVAAAIHVTSLRKQKAHGSAVKLSWKYSYTVYLFPFAWWQHCFEATLVNTQTDSF